MGARLSANLVIDCQSCVPSPRPNGITLLIVRSLFLKRFIIDIYERKYLRSRPVKKQLPGLGPHGWQSEN